MPQQPQNNLCMKRTHPEYPIQGITQQNPSADNSINRKRLTGKSPQRMAQPGINNSMNGFSPKGKIFYPQQQGANNRNTTNTSIGGNVEMDYSDAGKVRQPIPRYNRQQASRTVFGGRVPQTLESAVNQNRWTPDYQNQNNSIPAQHRPFDVSIRKISDPEQRGSDNIYGDNDQSNQGSHPLSAGRTNSDGQLTFQPPGHPELVLSQLQNIGTDTPAQRKLLQHKMQEIMHLQKQQFQQQQQPNPHMFQQHAQQQGFHFGSSGGNSGFPTNNSFNFSNHHQNQSHGADGGFGDFNQRFQQHQHGFDSHGFKHGMDPSFFQSHVPRPTNSSSPHYNSFGMEPLIRTSDPQVGTSEHIRGTPQTLTTESQNQQGSFDGVMPWRRTSTPGVGDTFASVLKRLDGDNEIGGSKEPAFGPWTWGGGDSDRSESGSGGARPSPEVFCQPINTVGAPAGSNGSGIRSQSFDEHSYSRAQSCDCALAGGSGSQQPVPTGIGSPYSNAYSSQAPNIPRPTPTSPYKFGLDHIFPEQSQPSDRLPFPITFETSVTPDPNPGILTWDDSLNMNLGTFWSSHNSPR